jgi:cytochrome c-type biogenesis protein CcsB
VIPILETLPTVYLFLYVALALAFVVQGSLAAGGRLTMAPRFAASAVFLLFAAALGLHLFHFVMRWIINEHAPLQSKHEVFTATGLTTMIFCAGLYFSERVWKTNGAAALLGNVVFFLITGLGGILWTLLGMKEDYKIANLVPALQSGWHPPHVSAYMLGYGSLGLASVLALLSILGALGNRLTGGRLPVFQTLSGPLLDRWTYKIAGLGFPFMTAALCMGALWADASWGEYWFWDSKETWALTTWAVFLIYFHLRFVRGWAGLKAQSVVFLGGIVILITYLAIGYLPASQASLHVYN